jgi:glycosyltransferase involved in cell wall biosynthesis
MINENPLVSIIIPAYNIEDYIQECLESVIAQTYENIQIIVVDDGSSDSTGIICDNIAEKDKRITVIHQENQGVVYARAQGAEKAEGRYIAFVDGDDYIEPDMISFMINNVEDCQCITTAVFREIRPGYSVTKRDEYTERIFTGNTIGELFSTMIYDEKRKSVQPLTPWLFNKLYEAQMMKVVLKHMNHNIKYGEDSLAVYQYLLKCNSIKITHKPFYHYRYRSDSAIHNVDIRAIDKITDVYEQLNSCLKDKVAEYRLIQQLQHWYVVAVNAAIKDRMGFDEEACAQRFFANIPEITDTKVVLYAAGAVGRDYYRQLITGGANIVAWVDKNYRDLKKTSVEIKPLSVVMEIQYDLIIIAVEKEDAAQKIVNELTDMGIPKEKLLWKKPYCAY